MSRYYDEPAEATEATPVDPREKLIANFIRCERRYNEARNQRDELSSEIDKCAKELSAMREQIGDAFGLTEYAAQKESPR